MGMIMRDFSDFITISVIIISIVAYLLYRSFTYWHKRGIDYLRPSIPFGNFGPTFMQQKSFGEQILHLYNQTTKPIIGIYAGFRPALLVRDPELVQAVLVKDFQSFHDRGLYIDEKNDPLSGNLVLLSGEKWKNLRGKLTPTFTTGKLKAMFSTLIDCGGALSKYLEVAANEERIIEFREILAQYTTNVIASVAFGIEVDSIKDPDTAFRKIGRKAFEPTILNAIRDGSAFLFPRLQRFIKLKSIDQEVEDFMISVVKQNMEYRENNNVTRKDFFQLLVQLRNTGTVATDGDWETKIATNESDKSFSINECAAQAFIFFLAGFETSSTTMSFVLYELARSPACQRKVQQEIDETLKKHNGQITYEAVHEMKYLESCIDETLRIYPPLPFLNRVCNKDWKVPGTDRIIEKGTFIFVPAHAIQNDSKYYPEPEQFHPDRFNADNTAGKTFLEMPYMPFGEGPRNCIGLRLGKMQTKVGLIILLQSNSYALAGNTKTPLVMCPKSILMTPVGGMELKVTRRIS